ncbi:MAG TPA: hypothetical protein VNS32_27540 [Flavisolibacter sp.]|nr:hypothetical protein [Flavisolibacter sp.]
MPNSSNKSNGKSNAGKGVPKHQVSRDTGSKSNPERSDRKYGRARGEDNNTGRTSSQGRKTASGGSD